MAGLSRRKFLCRLPAVAAPPAASPLIGTRGGDALAAEHDGHGAAPGVKYAAWTYSGRVPGPTFRAREGERLRVHFVNASEHPHTIHFHGIHGAAVDGVVGVGRGNLA